MLLLGLNAQLICIAKQIKMSFFVFELKVFLILQHRKMAKCARKEEEMTISLLSSQSLQHEGISVKGPKSYLCINPRQFFAAEFPVIPKLKVLRPKDIFRSENYNIAGFGISKQGHSSIPNFISQ